MVFKLTLGSVKDCIKLGAKIAVVMASYEVVHGILTGIVVAPKVIGKVGKEIQKVKEAEETAKKQSGKPMDTIDAWTRVTFKTRTMAESALGGLCNMADVCGYASVSDLYRIAGYDYKGDRKYAHTYGWSKYTVEHAGIFGGDGAYQIALPDPTAFGKDQPKSCYVDKEANDAD